MSASTPGRHVLVAAPEHELQILDLVSSTITNASRVPRMSGPVFSMDYDFDSSCIALGSRDGRIRIVSEALESRCEFVQAHSADVECVRFAPRSLSSIFGECLLVSAGDDGLIHWWSLSDSHSRLSRLGTLRNATDHGNVWCLGFLPLTSELISSSSDASVRLWNLERGITTRRLGNEHFSPPGAAPSTTTSRHSETLSRDGYHTNAVGWVEVFGPSCFATASRDCTIRLWDIRSARNGCCVGVLSGHTRSVWCLHAMEIGMGGGGGGGGGLNKKAGFAHLLLSGSSDRTVRLWDLRNIGSLALSKKSPQLVQSQSPSHSGCCCSDQSSSSSSSPAQVGIFAQHAGDVYQVTSVGPRCGASCGADGFVHIFDCGAAGVDHAASSSSSASGSASAAASLSLGASISFAFREIRSGSTSASSASLSPPGGGRRTQRQRRRRSPNRNRLLRRSHIDDNIDDNIDDRIGNLFGEVVDAAAVSVGGFGGAGDDIDGQQLQQQQLTPVYSLLSLGRLYESSYQLESEDRELWRRIRWLLQEDELAAKKEKEKHKQEEEEEEGECMTTTTSTTTSTTSLPPPLLSSPPRMFSDFEYDSTSCCCSCCSGSTETTADPADPATASFHVVRLPTAIVHVSRSMQQQQQQQSQLSTSPPTASSSATSSALSSANTPTPTTSTFSLECSEEDEEILIGILCGASEETLSEKFQSMWSSTNPTLMTECIVRLFVVLARLGLVKYWQVLARRIGYLCGSRVRLLRDLYRQVLVLKQEQQQQLQQLQQQYCCCCCGGAHLEFLKRGVLHALSHLRWGQKCRLGPDDVLLDEDELCDAGGTDAAGDGMTDDGANVSFHDVFLGVCAALYRNDFGANMTLLPSVPPMDIESKRRNIRENKATKGGGNTNTPSSTSAAEKSRRRRRRKSYRFSSSSSASSSSSSHRPSSIDDKNGGSTTRMTTGTTGTFGSGGNSGDGTMRVKIRPRFVAPFSRPKRPMVLSRGRGRGRVERKNRHHQRRRRVPAAARRIRRREEARSPSSSIATTAPPTTPLVGARVHKEILCLRSSFVFHCLHFGGIEASSNAILLSEECLPNVSLEQFLDYVYLDRLPTQDTSALLGLLKHFQMFLEEIPAQKVLNVLCVLLYELFGNLDDVVAESPQRPSRSLKGLLSLFRKKVRSRTKTSSARFVKWLELNKELFGSLTQPCRGLLRTKFSSPCFGNIDKEFLDEFFG